LIANSQSYRNIKSDFFVRIIGKRA
jgi:hypothetical protein